MRLTIAGILSPSTTSKKSPKYVGILNGNIEY